MATRREVPKPLLGVSVTGWSQRRCGRSGPPAVSQHVETQAAMLMREAGITHGAVTINNRMCSGDLSFEKAIRTILPRGSVLDVWETGATRPRRIEGQA